MTTRQIGALGAFVAATIVGTMGGQFVIQKHFESRRFQLSSEVIHELLSSGDQLKFRSGPEFGGEPDKVASSRGAPRAARAAVGDTHDVLYFPESLKAVSRPTLSPPANTPAAGRTRQASDATGTGSHAIANNVGESTPAELATPRNASPIETGDENQKKTAAQPSVEHTPPHIEANELEVWLEELADLPEHMVRDILRIRRKLGSAHPAPASDPPPVVSGTAPGRIPILNRLLPSVVAEGRSASEPAGEMPHELQSSIAAVRLARDVILNNLANANTIGFKRSRVHFEDLPYQHVRLPGERNQRGQFNAAGLSVGMGVQVAATSRDHAAGKLQSTGSQLDVAIDGAGFFRIQGGSDILYTRAGRFALNADGQIVLPSAHSSRQLDPSIAVPSNATEIRISSDGTVLVRHPGSASLSRVGRLQLARFINPAGLEQLGANLFAETDASGTPAVGHPGSNGCGQLRQGYLESPNVDLVQETRILRRLDRQLHALLQAIELLHDRQR